MSQSQRSLFDESKHPRGQPGNAGEFASKPNSSSRTLFGTDEEQAVADAISRRPSARTAAVAGQQQGLFDRGEFTTGQKSLFNVVRPSATKSAAKKPFNPELAGIFSAMNTKLREALKDKAIISPADAGIVVQADTLPGQRDLFRRLGELIRYKAATKDDTGPGRWITIGGSPSGGERHHGGVHVRIDGSGKIVAGPRTMLGLTPAEVGQGKVSSGKNAPEDAPTTTTRKQTRIYNIPHERLGEPLKLAINEEFKKWIGRAQQKPWERQEAIEARPARQQEAKAEKARRDWEFRERKGEFPILQSPGLNAEDAAIEEATQQFARDNWEAIRKKYLDKNAVGASDGTIQSITLNTDDWREMFQQYTGTNAPAVHEASSYCNKRMLGEALEMMKGVGNGKLAVFAGGGGSGKGTATENFVQSAEYPIVVDQVTGDVGKAMNLFAMASQNGYSPEVTFVDRDPSGAWIGNYVEKENKVKGGVVGRAASGKESGGIGRTVPLKQALGDNLKARQAAIELLKNHPEVPVHVINNNLGFGEAELITDRAQAIAYLEGQSHDFNSLFEKLSNDTQRLHELGAIPADIAAGLLPHRANENGRLQSGSASRGDQPGLSAGRSQEASSGGAGRESETRSAADKGNPRPRKKVGPGTLKVSELHVDPKRFQYKLNTDNPAGVTNELKESKRFNPELAGVIQVWRDPSDGKDYVVNGHHRYDLARRDGYEGDLQVYHIDVDTAEEARAVGALKNIASGHGTSIDAAKFLRDTGKSAEDIAAAGISLKGKTLKEGMVLKSLSQPLFDRVVDGTLPQGRAMAIAESLPDDHDTQAKLLRAIESKEEKSGRDLSDATVSEMAKEASLAGKRTRTTKTLWGDESFDESLMADRAEIKAAIKADLRSRINKFQAVATTRAAKTLAGQNTINADKNAEESKRLSQILDDFTRESSYTGPLNDHINSVAKEYSDASRSQQKRLIEQIKQRVPEILEELATSQAQRGSVASSMPEREGDAGSRSESRDDSIEPKPLKPLAGQKDFFQRRERPIRYDRLAASLRSALLNF